MLFSTSALTLSPTTGITDPCFTSFPHNFNWLWNSHKLRLFITQNCPHPWLETLNCLFWPQPPLLLPLLHPCSYQMYISLYHWHPNHLISKHLFWFYMLHLPLGPPCKWSASAHTYHPISLLLLLSFWRLCKLESTNVSLAGLWGFLSHAFVFRTFFCCCFYNNQGHMLDVGNSVIKEEWILSSNSSQINSK